MAKNNKHNVSTQLKESDDDFEFSNILDLPENEMLAEMIDGLMEASHRQMSIAVKLTKLVTDKAAAGTIDEEKIFAIFKRASKIVSESAPMKELWAAAAEIE